MVSSAGPGSPPLPASAPHSALPRCEESQEHGVYYFGRKVGYLLAWALELQPLGAVVILGSPESSRVLEPLDSEEVSLAQFAREHFRLATVSVQVNPLASVFRPALSENRQAFRKVWLPAGLVERASFLQPLHLAKHPEQHSPSANSRQVSINWAVFSAQQPQSESRSLRAIWLRLEVRQPVPCCQSADSQKASVSVDLSAEDFVQRWSF